MNLDSVPIWGLFLGTIVIVLAAIDVGYRLGKFIHRRSEEEKESPVSGVAGAAVGLLAFLLAFTFSIVTERFDHRKELVRDEANAVRTAYHRADFLPDADRAEARRLLREYLDARIGLAQSGHLDPSHVREVLSAATRTQDELWAMAVANARKDMNSDVAALYIESLNEVADVHALRVAIGVQTRIPVAIWAALYTLTILAMLIVGYHAGIAGSRRSPTGALLAIAFALVIGMIADLDRPDGFIKVTQQPLIDLRDAITPASQSDPGSARDGN